MQELPAHHRCMSPGAKETWGAVLFLINLEQPLSAKAQTLLWEPDGNTQVNRQARRGSSSLRFGLEVTTC